MSSVLAITANAADCNNSGGIKVSYGILASDVTAVTVGADGEITGFTLEVGSGFSKLEFDDETDVAFFNQEGSLNGSAIEFAQTANMQFNGVNQTKIKAANNAKVCCATVWVHYHESGQATVQGIEVDTAGNWSLTKNRARVVPSANTGTGAENEVLIYNVQSVSRYLAPTCTLTETAIEAL